ncbi:HD domain-containing protein [Cohnella pontilimi]|uniref:HD domain-containing protein n=1 Tax=Cohnella pontilimi TaxID=2564100 RepID=A0A4U0FG53_9BACL|nr:HD domain-containing protein [Cohnella pontilimi]TJY43871.1 HD domain-containing protein [Cohnella pontilimi]
MNVNDIIHSAEQFVKKELESDHTGHDWWHIERVRRLALEIAKLEKADPFICELAALLHDVADEKLNVSKEAGLDKVRTWLFDHVEDVQVIEHVMTIISTMSFNGGANPPMDTLEGQIVQDADRLDAIGAIGIARTFTYGGSKGRVMHDPFFEVTDTHYRSPNKTTIYHFYEKLLKLKDLMNTAHARRMAEDRHEFMLRYLEQFYKEWNVTEDNH